jgi:protein phosphatase
MCGTALGHTSADEATDVAHDAAEASRAAEEADTLQARGSLDVRAGRRTDVGRLRESNEDSLLVLEGVWNNRSVSRPVGLYVVADGIGGNEGGEIASGMLVSGLARRAAELLPGLLVDEPRFDGRTWLAGAIQSVNEEIFEWAREAGYDFGTTVVAVLLRGEQALIAHVGDSRVYLINASRIEQLTVDHSLVESLVIANQISREEARAHPNANVIYRTVGDQANVAVDLRVARLMPGDRLLLCSDGLSGMITDETIHQLVMNAPSPQPACDALVDAANAAGGEDNCTVILVELRAL